MITIILLYFCLSTGCEKTKHFPPEEARPDSTSVIPDDDNPQGDDEEDDTPITGPSIVVGEGKGEKLVIDGKQQSIDCKSLVYIKGGKYSGIVIRNIDGEAGCPVKITNEGLVELAGYRSEMSLSNLSHVIISGNGQDGVDKGFVFKDNDYRAVVLNGAINNFTLQYMSFSNIGSYVISHNEPKAYTGAADSYLKNLKFLHLSANNTAKFMHFEGSVSQQGIQGLIRGIEIAHNTVTNSPNIKNAIALMCAEDYDIHDNRFEHVNTANDDHNAMVVATGHGKFHNNYVAKHQGNAIRAWAVTIGNQAKTIEIFNNLVINSRKYSAFEVQSFTAYMVAGKTTYANARIFNNTCGGLNLSQDWYGTVVDAYRLLGGTCEVFNNLAFNLSTPHPKSMFVSLMSIDDSALKEYNNLYFKSSSEAGLNNEADLLPLSNSPVKKAGVVVAGLTSDYYGHARNTATPSVGGVE